MFIEDDEGIFEVTPQQGINEASFLIRVKDSSRVDFEKASGMKYKNILVDVLVPFIHIHVKLDF